MYLFLGLLYLLGILGTPGLVFFYGLHFLREIDWDDEPPVKEEKPPVVYRGAAYMASWERQELIDFKKRQRLAKSR